MEQAYAQALWNMVAGGMNHSKAVSALQGTLKAEGRESLFPRIGSAFARIALRESKRSTITLTIARASDEAHAKREVKGALKECGLEDREIITRIDPSVIGGWRMEGAEHLIDASYKKHLLTIYQQATNS